MLILMFRSTQLAFAHGGVVVTSGLTDRYEWLAAIDPYPLTPGVTVFTLLVYDRQTYQPVTDLEGELYLAPPGSPTPCCQEGVHIGPLKLDTDPGLFPGDYSTVIDIDQPGEWIAKFTLVKAGDVLDVPVPFRVQPGRTGSLPTAGGDVGAAATATVFAQNVAAARQTPVAPVSPLSPLDQPASPLMVSMRQQTGGAQAAVPVVVSAGSSATLSRAPTLPLLVNWPLWGGLALVPIVLIFMWALRPHDEES
jgi:hypothetical protein